MIEKGDRHHFGGTGSFSAGKGAGPFFRKIRLFPKNPPVSLLILGTFLISPFSASAAETTMKTLSAHVVKVAEDGSSLDVDFRHPATEEIRRMTFHVDHQTGLSKIEKLQDLRSGQVVSIDYVEGEKHRLLIRRIARFKLSGPPPGLEKFRGL